MTEAATRKQKVRYRYDALGRRVSRGLGYGKEQTKFTYDGQDVLVDDNFGTQTKYLNGSGLDNKLRSTTGSTASYFLADHLGSTNGLANSSGALTASNSYDSFGNPTNTGFSSRYQFTGREYDSVTGLQFSRARFYDPNLGRFISEDPIGFRGGDVNLYSYVGNNPVGLIDPLGTTASGNVSLLFDFFTGLGDTNRTYQLGSPEQQEMSASPGGQQLREAFYSNGCKNTEFEYTTGAAARDTLANPYYWPDTSFQVGGFQSSARRSASTVSFRIGNYAGANSFFYHFLPNFPDNGPFRTIYQDFHWDEPVEACRCRQ